MMSRFKNQSCSVSLCFVLAITVCNLELFPWHDSLVWVYYFVKQYLHSLLCLAFAVAISTASISVLHFLNPWQ